MAKLTQSANGHVRRVASHAGVTDAIEEVVDGEVLIMPPAKWKHALIVANLHDALSEQLDRREFTWWTAVSAW